MAENKAAFEKLLKQKPALEVGVGEPLSWEKLEGKRASRIGVYRESSIDDSPEMLDGHRAWMAKQLVQMGKVFGRLLPGLNAVV